MSEKYGFCPFPSHISEKEYTSLLTVVPKEQSLLLSRWFCLDTNAISPVYVLRSISEVLVDYNNDSEILRKNVARKEWDDDFKAMQTVLRHAAVQLSIVDPFFDMKKYIVSGNVMIQICLA